MFAFLIALLQELFQRRERTDHPQELAESAAPVRLTLSSGTNSGRLNQYGEWEP